MKNIMYLIAILGGTLLVLYSASGQVPMRKSGWENAFAYIRAQNREDAVRAKMDICFSVDDAGKVTKISIRPNQADGTDFHAHMKRENVIKVIDDLWPESDRGEKLRENNISFGRALVESTVYQNVQIDLTIVCRETVCGISYVEIRRSPDRRV